MNDWTCPILTNMPAELKYDYAQEVLAYLTSRGYRVKVMRTGFGSKKREYLKVYKKGPRT